MDKLRRFLNRWADFHLLLEAGAVALLVLLGAVAVFR
jgi:hypothetical protein